MDTNLPDDLSDLERRLAAWRPAAEGLSTDAMLFAAGRAAGRAGPARFVWPSLTCLLSVLAAVLGTWLAVERSERLLLAQRIGQQAPRPSPSPTPAVVPSVPLTAEEPAPSSFLVAHWALASELDDWPAQDVVQAPTPGPPLPNPPVLQVGHRDALLDP